MILLELTEKETDFIKEVIALEKVAVANSDVGFAEKERKTGICDSFLAKVEAAEKPKEDLLITYKDLFYLISATKEKYLWLGSEIYISNKLVEQNYYNYISLANALIMWFNSKGILKKLAAFDYTDQSAQYEETDE
jgi:hypothetical protein